MSSEIEAADALSAGEIGRRISEGRLDPRALTEHRLELAAAHVGDGGEERFTFTRLATQRARSEAAAARDRARRGLRRGPLDGVPISWKDNFDMAGLPTEAGAPKLARRLAQRDAAVVARAARAGVVALGKTHLSELAFSGLGYNGQTATPPNRYDPAAVPGGSSAGAAASVALGLCPAAIGSDTGGSVRIPAAWNGLVGLKTTAGSLPMTGVTPLSPTLDTIGPLTRDVADAALLFAMLRGTPPSDLREPTLHRTRFLAAEGVVLDGMTEAGRAGYDAAVAALGKAGAAIAPIDPPECADALDLMARQGAIVNTQAAAIWGAEIAKDPEAISPMIRARIEGGADYRADQIDAARLELNRLSRSLLARMAGADALLLPSVANKAPPVALIAEGGEAAMAENILALRNTRLANVFGLCALSLPAGLDAEGAPVSLMLFGRPFEEARLLRLGAAMEAALVP